MLRALQTPPRHPHTPCKAGHDPPFGLGRGTRQTKYAAYTNAISSAEDFIENIATQSINGKQYYVVHDDGTETLLDEWLTEKLKAFRREGESGED